MSFTVDKIIRRESLTINGNASIKDAINTMSRENVGLLVIVNDAGKPIGVVSERDIIRALARGKDLNTKVTEVGVVGKLVTVSPQGQHLQGCITDERPQNKAFSGHGWGG
ncbi:CBS domain-containing protein [Vulcanisaeta souniana]|uniref:CBS domain-containing protein n=1 Tax=Vulcanisaeta souniana TaxID=164452 RepID=UPI0006D2A21C|nr:CBS domain-containing protein [Vulcanisaeta souniana]